MELGEQKAGVEERKGKKVARWDLFLNAFSLFGLAVTIVGYFAGPLPAVLPGRSGIWVALAGLAIILVVGVASLWNLASKFSVHLQDAVDERLRVSYGEMQSLLETARVDQIEADSLQSAMSDLASVAHSLQNSKEQIANVAENEKFLEFRSELHQALGQFAQILSVLTEHEVRACIKVMIFTPEGQPRRVAVTLARSNTANADPPERFDLIRDNTDFQAIAIGHSIWHCGDVSSLADYRNTSPNRKYRSVLVWGMRSIPVDNEAVWGFLCVDSVAVNALDVRRVVPYGWWFIDAFRALYRALPEALSSPQVLRDSFAAMARSAITT